jgi:hypothetical protein
VRGVGTPQPRQEGLRAIHHAPKINLHDPLEVLVDHAFGLIDHRDAGVVDQQVDLPMQFANLGGQSLDRRAVGNIDYV